MSQITFLVTIFVILSSPFTGASAANKQKPVPASHFTCIADHGGGLNYAHGVKMCPYYCESTCTNDTSVKIIAGSAEGSFGSYNCFGAIIQIQPSMNGDLSANASGYKRFNVELRGMKSYYHSWMYADLYDQLNEIYEANGCEQK